MEYSSSSSLLEKGGLVFDGERQQCVTRCVCGERYGSLGAQYRGAVILECQRLLGLSGSGRSGTGRSIIDTDGCVCIV